MNAMQPPLTPAAETYAGLAPFYDELTREHDYDGWTRHLEATALRFGVSGRRLLDAACGTGKSFLPFLAITLLFLLNSKSISKQWRSGMVSNTILAVGAVLFLYLLVQEIVDYVAG